MKGPKKQGNRGLWVKNVDKHWSKGATVIILQVSLFKFAKI